MFVFIVVGFSSIVLIFGFICRYISILRNINVRVALRFFFVCRFWRVTRSRVVVSGFERRRGVGRRDRIVFRELMVGVFFGSFMSFGDLEELVILGG